MIRLLFALILTAGLASARSIGLRGFLHDPVRPAAEDFLILDQTGAPIPITWRIEGWSQTVSLQIEAPELMIQTKDGTLAAKAKLPAEANRLLLILVRDPAADASPPYRAIVLDAMASTFPWGSSLAVSLLGVDTAIEAGEHRLVLASGKITKVPAVEKRDEFNMAQVNFHLQENGQWVPFTERRVQFVGDNRRVFLVHATPGSQQPSVTTLVDFQPQREPGT